MARPAVPRAVKQLLFALVMVSCVYFVQGAGPNQNSRYDLVRALVEDHTVQIDPYKATTHDISTMGGHWYCDKAPGLSLIAAVPYALGVRLAQPDDPEPSGFAIYLLTLATCSLATAFAAVVLLQLLVDLGLGLGGSLLAVVAWVLGTNAFAYAGLFVAHQLAAALVVFALAGIRAAERRDHGTGRLVFAAGFAAGFAVASELPVALSALAIGIYALSTLGLRRTLPYALGALIPAAMLGAYDTAAFGGPLSVGYQSLASEYFAAGVRSGFLGFGPPSLDVVAELTVHEYRGLLPLSPFLVLAVPGACWMLRARASRRLGVLCIVAFAGLLVAISGFRFWNGGAAMGPRHLVPVLPFLIIAVAVAIDRLCRLAPRVAPPIAVAFVAVSIAICTACVAVQPELFDVQARHPPAPELAIPDREHPITEIVFPLLVHGYVSTKASWSGNLAYATLAPGHDDDAYNLGEVIGLSGMASLIPLLAAWFAFGVAFMRQLRRAAP
jgi:hypothetical protein